MSSAPTTIKIIADDREHLSGIPEILSRVDNLDLQIARLPLGDYQINDHIIFERKTLNDFIQSIIDGRLFSQASRLASSNYNPAIILEGTTKDIADRKMPRQTIQGAIINLSLIMGIPILRSMDAEETAKLLIYTARQINSFATGNINRPGYRPKGKRRRQLYILQGLPGIGRKRANLLLEKFQTVQAVFSADADALASVEGIGENTAEQIRNCVCEERTLYGI